jgi:hypothetical protein
LEHQFVTEIDGVCEILSVEPPWLLMPTPFNPKNTPPLGGFNCSRSSAHALSVQKGSLRYPALFDFAAVLHNEMDVIAASNNRENGPQAGGA